MYFLSTKINFIKHNVDYFSEENSSDGTSECILPTFSLSGIIGVERDASSSTNAEVVLPSIASGNTEEDFPVLRKNCKFDEMFFT